MRPVRHRQLNGRLCAAAPMGETWRTEIKQMSLHPHWTPEHTTATESMKIPRQWLAEAGVETFVPAAPSFRCTEPHVLIPLIKIEKVVRTRPLDANGFCRDRMMRILVGIRTGMILCHQSPWRKSAQVSIVFGMELTASMPRLRLASGTCPQKFVSCISMCLARSGAIKFRELCQCLGRSHASINARTAITLSSKCVFSGCLSI